MRDTYLLTSRHSNKPLSLPNFTGARRYHKKVERPACRRSAPMKTTMKTSITLPGISIPNLSETLRLARVALTAEEFDEWLAQISTAEQAGQEAAA